MSRFACPSCSGQFEVAAENLGKTVRCPHCGSTLGTSLQSPPSAGRPAPVQTQVEPSTRGNQSVPAGQIPAAQPTEQQPEPLPGYGYPGLGTAASQPNPAGTWSFLLAIVYYLAQCGLLGVLVNRVGTGPGAQERLKNLLTRISTHPPGWLIAFGLLTLAILLVSFVMGLYAVTRPNRRKGLAVAGLVLSGLGLLCGLVNMFGGH